jgi:large subunit ribosomal protein L13
MQKVNRATHTIDATGKAPGRLATEISRLLIGKHKADFTPNVDGGDAVDVVNAAKMTVTGKKMENKVYHHHTAHPGGLRSLELKKLWTQDPGDALRRAVSRMLPKNRHRNERMKRLTIKN